MKMYELLFLFRVIIVLSLIMLLMYLLLIPCILVSHINKLKKWLFYIDLLTTITKALYQSSEKGMSLLFTCPQLTGRRKLTTGCCCKNAAALYYQIDTTVPQVVAYFNAL